MAAGARCAALWQPGRRSGRLAGWQADGLVGERTVEVMSLMSFATEGAHCRSARTVEAPLHPSLLTSHGSCRCMLWYI